MKGWSDGYLFAYKNYQKSAEKIAIETMEDEFTTLTKLIKNKTPEKFNKDGVDIQRLLNELDNFSAPQIKELKKTILEIYNLSKVIGT